MGTGKLFRWYLKVKNSEVMMKFFLLVSLVSVPLLINAQPVRNFKKEASLLKTAMLQNHVQPKTIDDKFSAALFDGMLRELDPEKLYFAETDIKSLTPYRNALDEELYGGNWVFLGKVKELYNMCLKRAEYDITTTLDAPLTWNEKDTYDTKGKTWANDANNLKLRHQLWLKHRVLDKLADMYERDTLSTAENFFKTNLSDAVKRVKTIELRNIRELINDPAALDARVGEAFLKVMTGLFDPHSSYLSIRDLQKFMERLSTEGYYYGFSLNENDDKEIVIASLQPGGPAWKSGELHVSDRVISVTIEGKPPIDMTSVDLEQANALLDDMNHTYMIMEVRKMDGVLKTVRLRKEKISVEENLVHSFVLKGERKVGYIFLPDFYTKWTDEGAGARCANDVAREIIKLRKDSIEALILDVRYNGGGSLQEALAMAGIFINEGPLAVTKDKEKKIVSLKDMNRGTVYDGPLLLMVNGQSASASELLAATLQDYNRGLVVGSQTFGKATAQSILPLDPTQKGIGNSSYGYARVTIEKLYRITGKTVQGRGVKPDISLPDIFEVIDIHEEDMPNTLVADTLIRNNYAKILPPMPRYELERRSTERVATDPSFVKLKESYGWIDNVIKNDTLPVPLSWKGHYAKKAKDKRSYQKTMKETSSTDNVKFQVLDSSADQTRLSLDEHAREFKNTWSRKLKNDIYVKESFNILCDYINLLKKT
jgi:carboxyl-terminal processing protease